MYHRLKACRTWIALFCAIAVLITILLKLILDVSVIRIVPMGQSNSDSKGINVHISSIVKNNNEVYDLAKMKPEGWYTIWDTNIENYGDSEHPFIIRTHRYDSLQITFFNNPYMGIVEIETAEQKYRLDLYTPNEYGSTPVDIPFSTSEPSSWKVSAGIGCFAAAAITAYLYLLVHLRLGIGRRILLAVGGSAAAIVLLMENIDFGRVANCFFVATYGLLACFILPQIFVKNNEQEKKRAVSLGYFVILTLISGYASVATLYTRLIQPHNSFHFGIYGAVQFFIVFVYWFLCFFAVNQTIEKPEFYHGWINCVSLLERKIRRLLYE